MSVKENFQDKGPGVDESDYKWTSARANQFGAAINENSAAVLAAQADATDAQAAAGVAQSLANSASSAAVAALDALPDKADLDVVVTLTGNQTIGGDKTFTGTVAGITKAMVGLGSANNTADADKPVSSAQQTALDLKVDKVVGNSRVLTTDASGNPSSLAYSGSNVNSSIVQRNSSGNISTDVFIAGAASTVSSGGTLTLTVDSTQVQIITGTANHTVKLPTSSIIAGHPVEIVSLTTGTVTVQSSDGTTIVVLATNQVASLRALQATPTTPAHWTDGGKVDKTTTGNRIYGTDSGGAPMLFTVSSTSLSSGTLMLRTTGGVTSVGTATADTHAVPKLQMDTALALKESIANRNQPNGYPDLDGGGKIRWAQLPAAVMAYIGVWNASTNSPTLVDGTGDIGDMYRVGTAGTRNLGSGSQTFDVGDYVIYNSVGVWEKSDTTDAVASVAGLTGPISASSLRTALSLVIGTDVQAASAILTSLAGLTGAADNDIIQRKSGAFVNRTVAQFKTDLALGKSDVGLNLVDNTSDATKRLARVTTITSSATPTYNIDACDAVDITALAANITSMTAGRTGTINNFQPLLIRIYSAAAQTISWGSDFVAGSVPLPTTTIAGKVMLIRFFGDSAGKLACEASGSRA